VFASKAPDLRGATLTSGVAVQLDAENLSISRSGSAASITITAKDCAAGGVFQMEPQRADGTRTRIVHTLATSTDPTLTPFYYDTPHFRAPRGVFRGSPCPRAPTGPAGQFCVPVATRVNISNAASPRFVARDSAQVATRVTQADCNTATPLTPSARHCG